MKTKIKFLLLFLLIFSEFISSQSQDYKFNPKFLDANQYEVVNDLFSSNHYKFNLLSLTDYSKSWAVLMNPEILDNQILGNCIEGKELVKWTNIFTNDDWQTLNTKILQLRPFKLKKSKLSKSINLIDCISANFAANIISAPIIIKNYAFIKQSDIENETIIIAKKVSDKWVQWCRKEIVVVFD